MLEYRTRPDKSNGVVDGQVPEANILAISIESNRGVRCTSISLRAKISLLFQQKYYSTSLYAGERYSIYFLFIGVRNKKNRTNKTTLISMGRFEKYVRIKRFHYLDFGDILYSVSNRTLFIQINAPDECKVKAYLARTTFSLCFPRTIVAYNI